MNSDTVDERVTRAAVDELLLDAPGAPRPRALWHPSAIRNPKSSAGPMRDGGAKITWHTTETTGLPPYPGLSAPHFTLEPNSGQLYQHIALNMAAPTLKANTGNYARNYQVELRGYAKDTPNWSEAAYANIARLARWLEANCGVPRKTTVTFKVGATRLSAASFAAYTGHIGHEHAPSPNDHWDPGAFKIDLVLNGKGPAPYPPLTRTLKRGSRGGQVGALKLRLHKRGYRFIDDKPSFGLSVEAAVEHFQRAHNLDVDGIVGPQTWAALFS